MHKEQKATEQTYVQLDGSTSRDRTTRSTERLSGAKDAQKQMSSTTNKDKKTTTSLGKQQQLYKCLMVLDKLQDFLCLQHKTRLTTGGLDTAERMGTITH